MFNSHCIHAQRDILSLPFETQDLVPQSQLLFLRLPYLFSQ